MLDTRPADDTDRGAGLDAIEQAIRRIEDAQRALQRLREAEKRAQDARDALIRQAALLGAARKPLAERIGLQRSHLYLVLNEPHDPEADEAWQSWLEDAHVEAHTRWESNGQEGEPDDYWPL